MHIKRALAVLAISASSFSVHAAPIFNSGNGHYYEVFSFSAVDDGSRKTWDWAKNFAQNSEFNGSHGYLATITSKDEDDFVWSIEGAQGTFLGAYDNSSYDNNGALKHNHWSWVTGEAFSYSNWLPGEPNHWQDGSAQTPDKEDYLMYWWAPNAGANGRWNDTNIDSSWMDGDTKKYSTHGFIVEYEPAALASAASVPLPPTIWLLVSGLAFFMKGKKGNRRVS